MYKLPEDLGCKYRFVSLASKRAEQLQGGALPLVETEDRKSTVIAQEEVAIGVVAEWSPEAEPVEGEAGFEEEEEE